MSADWSTAILDSLAAAHKTVKLTAMAIGPRDSRLDLIRLGSPFGEPAEPGPAAGKGRAADFANRPAGPPSAAAAADPQAQAPIWLDGDSLLCRCPDCGAPMSIRLWLLLADCWQCGTSLELSEQQERQIQELLARQAASHPAPAKPLVDTGPRAGPMASAVDASPLSTAAAGPRAAPATRAPGAPRTPTARRSADASPAASVAVRPPKPLEPAVRPTRPSPRVPAIELRPVDRNWLRDGLRQTPAWLISLILHLLLIILLGLWDVEREPRQLSIVVSTAMSADRVEGELKVPVDAQDELAFDLPVPDNLNMQDRRVREALLLADQEARQLQLDPHAPAPQLADLAKVRELASSDDPVRRSLAVRDPRLRVLVVKREGGTTLTEAAVSRGLRWLAQQQLADGHWSERGGGWESGETALALLPFLGAGQTHFTGPYKDHVAKGLRWLLRRQRENGDLRGGESQHPGMYAHGLAAIVLCDAFAMTGDETLRGPAQKAVDFIVAAQSADGGWRYFPRQDSDLSVVGWQLMALQSARMAGLTVPPDTLQLAAQYLDKVGHEGGAVYSYQHRGGEARPTPAMTAEGLLCRMYLGWRKDEPALQQGLEILHASHLPSQRERNIYYWYYGTQVFHHHGGQPWEDWNRRMRDLLVESQVNQGPMAGSWNPAGDRWGAAGGRIFITALSTCCLEVYYRHAPIYRRIDLN